MNRQSMENQLNQLKGNHSIGWREFKIQDLFEKIPTNKLPYKAKGLRGIHNKVYNLPALTAGVLNQGLAYYVPREGATILKNVISVSANGANTGVMYYQPREFTVLQDSYAIKYSHGELNSKHYIYLVSALQKSIRGHYDWSNKAGWERIKKKSIKLPIDAAGEIAFDYMEEFISTIERERLFALKLYLHSTGLENTKLSKTEEKALQSINNLGKTYADYKDFSINELFNVYPSKSYSGLNDQFILNKGGKTPYVSNQSQNNGYIGWSNLEPLNEKNVITLSDTWQSERTIFYQPKEFIGKSHLQIMKSYNSNFNKYSALFIISSLRKAILGVHYDYGTKFNRERIKSTQIKLPINSSNEPDFEYMQNLIMGIQKIIIKSMVNYINKQIKTTKNM